MKTKRTMVAGSPGLRVVAAAPSKRRDAGGHMQPGFAHHMVARMREEKKHREDDGVEKPIPGVEKDSVARLMGEEFIKTATSGEDESLEDRDAPQPEDTGGPFVETTADTEFAHGVDASNPKDAKREPFPKT